MRKIHPAVLLGLVFACIAAAASSSAARPNGADAPARFLASPEASDVEPVVSWLDRGRALVAWTDLAKGPAVEAVVLDAAGRRASDPPQVVAESATLTDLASNGRNRAVAIWSATDGTGAGVFARLLGNNARPRRGAVTVNQTRAGDQRDGAAAMDRSGAFVVLWTSGGPDGSIVLCRRFRKNGASATAETLVSSAAPGDRRRPAVATGPDGSFVAVWIDGDARVTARRLDGSCAPLGEEIEVASGAPVFDVDVAVDALGRIVVAWGSVGADPSTSRIGSGILARRFAPDGAALGGALQVSGFFEEEDRFGAAVAATTDDRFVVSWTHEEDFFRGVTAATFAGGGASGRSLLGGAESGFVGASSIAAEGDRFVAAWAQEGFGDPELSPTGVFVFFGLFP